MNAQVHMARPRDTGLIRPIAEHVALTPCACTGHDRGSARGGSPLPRVLVTTGGGCATLGARCQVVRIGRRPPTAADRRANLWCAGSLAEVADLRAAGVGAELRVTGHADLTPLRRASRLHKSRATVFVTAPDFWLDQLAAALAELQAALPEIDCVVHVDIDPEQPRIAAWQRWAATQGASRSIVAVPPGVTDVLPTLAQADVLVAGEPEWIEPYLTLDRPIVLWGPTAPRWRDRYAGAVIEASAAPLPAAVSAALVEPGRHRHGRRRCAAEFAGDDEAGRCIAAAVESLLAGAA